MEQYTWLLTVRCPSPVRHFEIFTMTIGYAYQLVLQTTSTPSQPVSVAPEWGDHTPPATARAEAPSSSAWGCGCATWTWSERGKTQGSRSCRHRCCISALSLQPLERSSVGQWSQPLSLLMFPVAVSNPYRPATLRPRPLHWWWTCPCPSRVFRLP